MSSSDHFLHDLPAPFLQRSHAAARQKPHPFILVPAVNQIHSIARDRVMERGAGVLFDEFEERVPPRIFGEMENFIADFFELVGADGPNRFRDRFAAFFVQVLEIKCFKWHNVRVLSWTCLKFDHLVHLR